MTTLTVLSTEGDVNLGKRTVTVATGTIPAYASPAYRGTRTAVFVALGLCGLVPVSHALMTHGFATLEKEMGFTWLLVSAALYISGALI